MPFTPGVKVNRQAINSGATLYTWKGWFGSNKAQNLIIDCITGLEMRKKIYGTLTSQFCVQGGHRLYFYCPHGSVMSPQIASPIPLMQGSFEPWEVVEEGQLSYNYKLMPRKEVDFGLVYEAIIKCDRAERSKKDGDKLPAHRYDILSLRYLIDLRRLLSQIKLSSPHYLNVHCLFSRELSGRASVSALHNPDQLSADFHGGDLGRWEIIPIEKGE